MKTKWDFKNCILTHQVHLAQPSYPEKKAASRFVTSSLERSRMNDENTSLREQLYAVNGENRGFYEALKAM